MIRFLDGDLHHLFLVVRQAALDARLQQLGISPNAGQGRPQVMRQNGQHPGFERIQTRHRFVGFPHIFEQMLVLKNELLLFEGTLHSALQLRGVNGLNQVVIDRFLNGFDRHLKRRMTRHQNDQGMVIAFPHLTSEFQSRRVRKLEIDDDHVEHFLVQELDRLSATERR